MNAITIWALGKFIGHNRDTERRLLSDGKRSVHGIDKSPYLLGQATVFLSTLTLLPPNGTPYLRQIRGETLTVGTYCTQRAIIFFESIHCPFVRYTIYYIGKVCHSRRITHKFGITDILKYGSCKYRTFHHLSGCYQHIRAHTLLRPYQQPQIIRRHAFFVKSYNLHHAISKLHILKSPALGNTYGQIRIFKHFLRRGRQHHEGAEDKGNYFFHKLEFIFSVINKKCLYEYRGKNNHFSITKGF